MIDIKNELNDEELEKVAGGGWCEGDPTIDQSSKLAKSQVTAHIGKDLFFCEKSTWAFGTLKEVSMVYNYLASYEAYKFYIKKTNNCSWLPIGEVMNLNTNRFTAFLSGEFNNK